MKAAPLNAAHLTMMVHVTKVKVQWASHRQKVLLMVILYPCILLQM